MKELAEFCKRHPDWKVNLHYTPYGHRLIMVVEGYHNKRQFFNQHSFNLDECNDSKELSSVLADIENRVHFIQTDSDRLISRAKEAKDDERKAATD